MKNHRHMCTGSLLVCGTIYVTGLWIQNSRDNWLNKYARRVLVQLRGQPTFYPDIVIARAARKKAGISRIGSRISKIILVHQGQGCQSTSNLRWLKSRPHLKWWYTAWSHLWTILNMYSVIFQSLRKKWNHGADLFYSLDIFSLYMPAFNIKALLLPLPLCAS